MHPERQFPKNHSPAKWSSIASRNDFAYSAYFSVVRDEPSVIDASPNGRSGTYPTSASPGLNCPR